MTIVVIQIPREEIPSAMGQLIAAIEATGQSALDIVTAGLAMRPTSPVATPEPAPAPEAPEPPPTDPPVASTEGDQLP